MRARLGTGKRPAQFVPQSARSFLYGFSKADLAELVWDFAVMSRGDEAGTDADPSIVVSIIEEHAVAVWNATGRKYRSRERETASAIHAIHGMPGEPEPEVSE